jgi:hypothetical protein
VNDRFLSRLRVAWLAAVYLALAAPFVASAQGGASDGLTAPLPALPPKVEKGALHLIVFGSESQTPLAGVEVQVGRFSPVLTNDNGAVALVLPADTYTLTLALPGRSELKATLQDIPVTQDETTQVIVTLTSRATVEALDVESPVGAPRAKFGPEESAEERARPRGTAAGQVRSLETKQPVEGARIFVRGRLIEAQTDAQGRFNVELPEGEHTLSIIHTAFSTQTIDHVQVKGHETTELQVELTPAALELDDFVVTAPHIQGSVASLLDMRREQAAASDSIGAEDIARTPAGDAAGAAQRVVGVNIVDGRFVYVRGLGERYTNALLNGLPLPSPEPDRATVPLDLFPTRIIDSIDVAKTFTPDMPGDFAGGSVRIETVGVPDKLVLSGSLSTGFNSQSTFRRGPYSKGGRWDWLGLDDGTRALPEAVPGDYRLRSAERRPDGTRLTSAEVREIAPALNTPMGIEQHRISPDVGATLTVGNGWRLRGSHRVGTIGAVTYARKVRLVPNEQRRVFLPPGETGALPVWSESERDSTTENVQWSAFLGVTWEFLKHHKVRLLGFRSQLAEDAAEDIRGYTVNNAQDYAVLHQEYVARTLNLSQLLGEHELTKLGGAKLDWRVSLSNARRDQPDMRDAVWYRPDNGTEWLALKGPDSGRHFFSDQREKVRTAALDWTQPFKLGRLEHKLKLGAMLVLKDRDFHARRFNLLPESVTESCGARFDPVRCPARLYTDENIERGVLILQENTDARSDGYVASLKVYAGYLMADVGLHEKLRLIAGARLEATEQRVASLELLSDKVMEDSEVKLDAVDILPSATLIWSITDQLALRASGTRTLARPQLREIAPFAFANYYGEGVVSGNPNLDLTRVTNGDLRLEYFPSAREVFAASFFVKSFDAPIEPILKPTGGAPQTTYENAKGALLYGGELEARLGLDLISHALDAFTLIGNLTLARSQIDVKQSAADASGNVQFLTNTERPMVNQAPYVVNLMLDYEASTGTQLRLLYNVSGKQLVRIGLEGLDDAYLHPRHSLDFTAAQRLWEGLQLKLTLQNLLNAEYLITQGKEYDPKRVAARYRQGVSGSISVGYTY